MIDTENWNAFTYARSRVVIKTLFLSLVLAIASCLLFQPSANADTVELLPSSRVILEVSADMTIDDIIARVYPEEKDLWPRIKQKLIETNPQAFVQYSERLIPETRLKLVDIKRTYDPPPLTPKVPVGYVSGFTGLTAARDLNGREQQLQINSPVFEGDRLATQPGSKLQLTMDDGAEVFLKGDSVLKISEYVITDGYDKDSSSILELLRGGFRKVTGAIGASPEANYEVQTGLASIGIRGTEYVVKLCRQNDCQIAVDRDDADATLHALVLDGSISLTNAEQVQILMAKGQYATATSQALGLQPQNTLAVGFLDAGEEQKFDAAVSQNIEEESTSSNTWMWIVGILLLVVGL